MNLNKPTSKFLDPNFSIPSKQCYNMKKNSVQKCSYPRKGQVGHNFGHYFRAEQLFATIIDGRFVDQT